MKPINPLSQVAQFHRTFGQPIQQEPSVPGEDRCALRVSLIAEELKELEAAIKSNDIVEVADALCDLQYVLSGAVLEFGLGELFPALFDEVQRSNMSKACKSREEAETTMKHYLENHQTECYYKEQDGLFLVFRTSDNKVLKSVCYSPANLKEIMGKKI